MIYLVLCCLFYAVVNPSVQLLFVIMKHSSDFFKNLSRKLSGIPYTANKLIIQSQVLFDSINEIQ